MQIQTVIGTGKGDRRPFICDGHGRCESERTGFLFILFPGLGSAVLEHSIMQTMKSSGRHR